MMTTFSDEFFMKEAMKEAEKATNEDEVPVGAVIVSNNRIIARAHNMTECLSDVTAHAEMLAVTAAANFLGGKYLEGCTLYVTLEPCVMCAGALHHAHIERVVFAAEDTKRGFMRYGTGLLHPKTTISSGLMEKESNAILLSFFQKKRN
ncbi:MAG: tRNA-specific adenosine deaminase [Bacteroidetes bacterium HGW-Bacteroidetes-1]|jgi:tRNA(adenine34) deaminase|nr:MAG: tRNA-specific adenosine deaminase [Bacteroidetes bacterium HGW-Bacteroidetes-1]